MLKNIILSFAVIALLGSCKSTQTIGGSCAHAGTVIDKTGLDGCGLLIESEGQILLPLSLPEHSRPLQEGQHILFDYEVVPDVMGTCMAESAIVKLTCLTQEPDDSGAACADVKNPMEVDWMKRIAKERRSNQIVRYKYHETAWAYLFIGSEKYLYDCQGVLLCEKQNCLSQVDDPRNGVIIWVREYRGD